MPSNSPGNDIETKGLEAYNNSTESAKHASSTRVDESQQARDKDRNEQITQQGHETPGTGVENRQENNSGDPRSPSMSGPIQNVCVPSSTSPRLTNRRTSNRSSDPARNSSIGEPNDEDSGGGRTNNNSKDKKRWPFCYFVTLLVFDAILSVMFFLPILPWYVASGSWSFR